MYNVTRYVSKIFGRAMRFWVNIKISVLILGKSEFVVTE